MRGAGAASMGWLEHLGVAWSVVAWRFRCGAIRDPVGHPVIREDGSVYGPVGCEDTGIAVLLFRVVHLRLRRSCGFDLEAADDGGDGQLELAGVACDECVEFALEGCDLVRGGSLLRLLRFPTAGGLAVVAACAVDRDGVSEVDWCACDVVGCQWWAQSPSFCASVAGPEVAAVLAELVGGDHCAASAFNTSRLPPSDLWS